MRQMTDEQADDIATAWADAMYQAHLQAIVEDEQRRERKAFRANPFMRIQARERAEKEGR